MSVKPIKAIEIYLKELKTTRDRIKAFTTFIAKRRNLLESLADVDNIVLDGIIEKLDHLTEILEKEIERIEKIKDEVNQE